MSNNPAEIFPKALQYYMSARDKKQQDLIQDLHLSSATVSQWVNGKAFPRMDRVEMLAEYFGITTTELLSNPYDKPKPSTNPVIIAKLLEKSPDLYEMFTVALNLPEKDINLLKEFTMRLAQLHENQGTT
jgi:repressor LexA